MPQTLDRLLRHPALWRGTRHPVLPAGLPSGFAELDALLPGGGWPRDALTRIRLPEPAAGMGLLLPLLARLTRAGDTVALVAPPALPHAPGWVQAGVDLEYLLVVEASRAQRAWTLEQLLRSGTCAAVLGWIEQLGLTAERRLQLAAEAGGASGFLLHTGRQQKHSMAALSLVLEYRPKQLEICLLHGKGLRGGEAVRLPRFRAEDSADPP